MNLFDLFEGDATEGKIIYPDRINLYLNLRRPNAQPIRIAHNIPYKAMDAVIQKIVNKYSDVEADMFEFRPANSLREDSGENDLYAAYDKILIDLCDGIVRHQKQDSDRYGLVAAAVVDPDHRVVYGINHKLPSGKRVHAERAAMANYIDKYGEIPEHSVIITTLSPCVDDMPDRKGPSCTELLNDSPITRVYAGYRDPSQTHLSHDDFDVVYTEDKRIESVCKAIADCFLDEATIMDPADYRGEAIEEAFNGIDITLEIQKDDEYVDDDDYDNQVMYVTASSNGRELGHVLFSFDGDELLPQDLEVDERYRGQGIAKTMYDYVKSRGYKIRRSGQQTDAGAGFWDKHKPGKNVWEQRVEEGSEEALQFATQAHAGQTRSGGDPYISHPVRVANHIKQFKKSHNLDALLSAAYLHDTIEDTDTTQEILHDLFGGLVASLVKELTSDPVQIKKMGKAAYLSHKMAAMSSYALVIKLADRLDNVKDITTTRTPQWRQKYKAETEHILDYIEKNRVLSGTHKKLIGLIRNKISELGNEPNVAENFADGKHPGRKGLAKRSGVNTKASVSSLRKTAKHSTGEKARMAHWLANMKAGKAKKK